MSSDQHEELTAVLLFEEEHGRTTRRLLSAIGECDV